ncbi:MAG: hypothetical protein ACE5JF_04370 [Anaerolineales bacterium]
MASAQQEIEQANELARQGDSQAAIAMLSQLIQRDSSNVEAWLALADVVEEPERAEFCLQKVLSLDPGNAIALEKFSKSAGGSLSVGSVGSLGPADQALADESTPAEQPPEEADGVASEPAASQPSIDESTQRDEEPDEADAIAPDTAVPQPSMGEPMQEEAMHAPEISVEASPSDAAQVPAGAVQPATEPGDERPIAQDIPKRGSLGRTDLILIGLTVLAGIVLCALVSAALIN